MNQKGFSLVYIVFIVIILAAIIYGAFLFIARSLVSYNTPIVNPNQHDQLAKEALSEIHYFPIYPQAWFVKKETTLPCPSEMISGYTDCGSIAYRWQTSDPLTKVQDWYTNDKLKSYGWKMTGGAGARDSISQETWQHLSSGEKINLNIVRDRDNNLPTISVLLSNTDPDLFEASSSADIQNWATYRNTDLKFELKYPSFLKIDEKTGLIVFYNGNKRVLPPDSIIEPYDKSAMVIYDRGTNCSAECNKFPTVKKVLNGYPVVLSTQDNGNGQDFWISNHQKSKSLRFIYGTNQEYASDLAIYQYMLSTFKFID